MFAWRRLHAAFPLRNARGAIQGKFYCGHRAGLRSGPTPGVMKYLSPQRITCEKLGEIEMSIAFLFPGQGSQFPGMLHNLPDHPVIVQTLDQVSEILGKDSRELDSAEALRSTVSVQLALLASGVAVARFLNTEGVEPGAVAGMSAGAFCAAVACGTLNLADAVQLVRQRGEMMVELYPKGYSLAAIIGLNERQVSKIVQQAYSGSAPVYVANINAPRQIVISGSDEGIDRVLATARRSGARKAERLDVSTPSHCPLLQPVADALKKSLQTMHLPPPKMVYLGNVTGRAIRSAEAISEDLACNIAHGVRWYDMTTVLEELGFRLFLEMPPGHVLSVLAKEAFPDVQTLAVGESSIRQTLRFVDRYSVI
jgi:malonate decarboxylase epsilon subunit